MMHRIGRLIVGVLLSGLTVGTVQAQEFSLVSLDQALTVRDWQRADAIAAQLDAQAGQGDIMAAYAASVRHAESGQCSDAVILADLVIEAIPFFMPPYLVAYRCHSQLGRYDVAAARLGSLQAILPDGPERDLVTQLLQNEQSRGQPSLSGYFTAAPSTNVNRATSERTIDGGLWGPGTIPDEAREQRGVLFEFGGSVAVELARTEALTVSGVLRSDVRFTTDDERFEPSFTVETPVSFSVTDTARAVVAPYLTFGLDEERLTRIEAGARGTFTLPITAQQRLAVNLKVAAIERPHFPQRSGYLADGAVSLSNTLAPNINLTTTARAIYHHTDDESFRTLEGTLEARLDTLLEGGLLLGLEGTVGQRWHWRPAPFQTEKDQVDTFVTGRIDASHRDITFGPLMPSIYYEYTNSWSDNVFYDYESHDIGLSLRASF
ncbi:hypothetical protein NO932_07355 [Pelagibacterium sp. 26DY04]|uniref:surface lipoprotein assembly modifier n=1 Tax=Pelagibacterium sp. 26DY04 TaxID=2967130 RepID=UPI0028156B20|nr:hypothetical protein [Pelagibacterium sp. 26DY04]WMT88420.1 hypothetical protein NO932_07355 [Pelagibacterium sp. 26DY04]